MSETGPKQTECYDCTEVFSRALAARAELRAADPQLPGWSSVRRIKANEMAVDAVKTWVCNALACIDPGILILAGDVGRGKTMLEDVAYRSLLWPRNPLKTRYGQLVRVNELRDIFAPLQRAMALGDAGMREDAGKIKMAVNALIERAAKAPFLFYDDLWTQAPSAWRDQVLYRIFDARWNPPRPTIITTNLEPVIGGGHFAERVRSRLYGQRPAITVGGPDWRQQR
jgi:DNA replication protein DnaC